MKSDFENGVRFLIVVGNETAWGPVRLPGMEPIFLVTDFL